MRARTALIIGISLIVSQAAMAAKPSSITFKQAKANGEDAQYQRYVVKCSDGKSHDITSWDNRKLWCVGDTISDQAVKKNKLR